MVAGQVRSIGHAPWYDPPVDSNNPNERHQIPTLSGAPLNISAGQREEMETAAYLLRMVMTQLPDNSESVRRLRMLAHALETESEEGCRIYKFARQRAADTVRKEQVRKGIYSVTDGEMRALGLDKITR